MAVVLLPAVGYGPATGDRMLRVLRLGARSPRMHRVRIDYPGTGDSAGAATVLSGLRPWAETLTPPANGWPNEDSSAS